MISEGSNPTALCSSSSSCDDTSDGEKKAERKAKRARKKAKQKAEKKARKNTNKKSDKPGHKDINRLRTQQDLAGLTSISWLSLMGDPRLEGK